MDQATPNEVLSMGAEGQIALPERLLERLGWTEGVQLIATAEGDGTIRITCARDVVRAFRGVYRHLAEPGQGVVDELIAERHAEAKREGQG